MESGIRIGPYQILEKIGEGGMGAVYRGLDTRLEREVAIKVLPESLAQSEDSRARFQREAKMLAALNHRGIGAIFDLAQWNGVPCLILELVRGQTLEQRLGQGPLGENEAINLFIQATEAVESAHGLNILHRDLKPSNLMVTPEGRIKILDFGLAKALNRDFAGDAGLQTRDGDLLGTAAYFAPEQLYSAPLDQRVDVWALSCCLFQALTGRRAFPAQSLGETLNLIINGEPDWSLLADHPELRALLQEGLRKDPKQRLESAHEMMLRLRALSPERARPALLLEPARSSRWMWSLALLLGVGLAAGGYLLGLQRPQQRATDTRKPRFLSLSLPPNTALPREHPQSVFSSDGLTLIFPVVGSQGRQFYRKNLGQLEAIPLPDTNGGSFPFLSPDGQRLGYYANETLWSRPLGGGPTIQLIDHLPENQFLGACWLSDDSLVWATTPAGLQRLTNPRDKPETLIAPDAKNQDAALGWPVSCPAGLIFSARSAGTFHTGRVEQLELPSKKRTVLQRQAFGAQPGPCGGLLFVRGRSLMLDSQVLLPDVWSDQSTGETCFSASRGILAFARPGVPGDEERRKAKTRQQGATLNRAEIGIGLDLPGL